MSDNNITAHDNPVDAVILWVDGSDRALAEKRARYLVLEKKTGAHPGALPFRFASSDEIRYCILSILTFARFIRNIYLVTDGQDPGLNEEIRVRFPEKAGCLKIVDHKEIFRGYEQYLPTFNSSSIHSMIWRIKGLSERFVYFNDDVILIKELGEDDWFIENRPVLMGKWLLPPYRRYVFIKLKVLINKYLRSNKDYRPRISFYIRQWKSASLLGFNRRYFFHDHSPHPFSKKTLEDYFSAHPGLLEKTISYRFRDPDQVLVSSLAYHLEILSGNRNFRKLRIGYFHPYYPDWRLNIRIRRCSNDPRIKTVCMQSIEMMSQPVREKIISFMNSVLNLKA
jgi:hypothetical protein